MPLVYLPDREVLFLWETEVSARSNRPFAASGQPGTATLLTPEGRREVQGRQLALLETTAVLAVYPAGELERLAASVAIWALASKLAIDLIARERVVPTVARRSGRLEARWAAALSASEDAAKVLALSRSMPPAAHAVPVANRRGARSLVSRCAAPSVSRRSGRCGRSLDPGRAAVASAGTGVPERGLG